MSKKQKLIDKLLGKPRDLTFDEARNIMESYGYKLVKGGKVGGSRVRFVLEKENEKKAFTMHKPHPQNELLPYQVNKIIEELKKEGFI